MTTMTRRRLIGALGLTTGFGSLGLGREVLSGGDSPSGGLPWRYIRLAPAATAERAYTLYPDGYCMYATFTSIVAQVGEHVGSPVREFPCEMMKYGAGGVAGWGSLCGLLNGAAAAVALFAPTDKERRRLTRELLGWFEKEPLPIFSPATSPDSPTLPQSVAGSVLCGESTARWSEVSGHPAGSRELGERCRRVAADVAALTAKLLNSAVA